MKIADKIIFIFLSICSISIGQVNPNRLIIVGDSLKGKLVDAMQNGTPSVMTSIAAEGMFGDMEANGYVEDDLKAFAQLSVELYKNSNLC